MLPCAKVAMVPVSTTAVQPSMEDRLLSHVHRVAEREEEHNGLIKTDHIIPAQDM
jgi:hypothetical protein